MHRMRQTWLVWGLVPWAGAFVLTLFVASFAHADTRLSEMALERRFQVLLAFAAGLFLLGFSLDSHWTNAQKLARRLLLAAGLKPDRKGRFPKLSLRQRQELFRHNELVYHSLLSSVWALTIIGTAIAAIAVLAAAARLGLAYAAMLLIVAAAYQLFVFSRHAYYKEVITAAAQGTLAADSEEQAAEE